MRQMLSAVLLFTLLLSFIAPAPAQAAAARNAAEASQASGPDITAIIEKYRQQIPRRMEAEKVPGLALALVDDQGVLWAEGFGETDWNSGVKVTPDTAFAIQSMSKSFTATGAVLAAQAGLVDLDAPLPSLLPDFKVNSIFEEHPEQQMTMRRLLSHTAGLMHEAPIGGNFDLPTHTFEEHVASIQATWLRAPVGARYNYSNLGVDLAGYVLQVKAGKPFAQFEKETVLDPLGMTHSSFDMAMIRTWKDRAIGHMPSMPWQPVQTMLIIPSGGLYTTANDMARYLRFHINKGELDGQRLLQEAWAETMYTPPNPAARQAGYGLGIAVSANHGARRFQHGGGGFGFNSQMVWYPELKIGMVVLTNAMHDQLYAELPDQVIDDVIASAPELYAGRAKAAQVARPALAPTSGEALTASDMNLLIQAKALPGDPAAEARRAAYAGTYIATVWGLPMMRAEVQSITGIMTISYYGAQAVITEVEPGVFYDSGGDRVDLRGPRLGAGDRLATNYRNIQMVRVDERLTLAKWALALVAGLLGLLAVLFWALVEPVRAGVGAIRRRIAAARFKHQREAEAGVVDSMRALVAAPPAPQPSASMGWAGAFSVLAGLCSLAVAGMLYVLPDLRPLPWPRPYLEAGPLGVTALSAPYVGIAAALIAGVLAAWQVRKSKRAVYAVLTALVMLVAFGLLLV